jgi:guanylate kinase
VLGLILLANKMETGRNMIIISASKMSGKSVLLQMLIFKNIKRINTAITSTGRNE